MRPSTCAYLRKSHLSHSTPNLHAGSAAGSYALKTNRFVRQSVIDNHPKSYGRAPKITAFAANTNRSPTTLLTKKNQVKPKGQHLFSLTGEQRPLYTQKRNTRDKTLHSPAFPTKALYVKNAEKKNTSKKTKYTTYTSAHAFVYNAPHGIPDDWKTPFRNYFTTVPPIQK